MGRKPRRPPQDVPDSLPKRDEGTDVMPNDVRHTDDAQRMPPDSLPPSEERATERDDSDPQNGEP